MARQCLVHCELLQVRLCRIAVVLLSRMSVVYLCFYFVTTGLATHSAQKQREDEINAWKYWAARNADVQRVGIKGGCGGIVLSGCGEESKDYY